MSFRKDLTGQKFGRITVIKFAYQDKKRKSLWECQCEWGRITNIPRRTIEARINRYGWTIEKALTTKARKYK